MSDFALSQLLTVIVKFSPPGFQGGFSWTGVLWRALYQSGFLGQGTFRGFGTEMKVNFFLKKFIPSNNKCGLLYQWKQLYKCGLFAVISVDYLKSALLE